MQHSYYNLHGCLMYVETYFKERIKHFLTKIQYTCAYRIFCNNENDAAVLEFLGIPQMFTEYLFAYRIKKK